MVQLKETDNVSTTIAAPNRSSTLRLCLVYLGRRYGSNRRQRADGSAQLAVYQGADREKILIDGAKREGQFTLYTSHTWFQTFVELREKISLRARHAMAQ